MVVAKVLWTMRRSPHGERGLKSVSGLSVGINELSLPTRGAWIEIQGLPKKFARSKSLPTRGAWIEILNNQIFGDFYLSLPTRGAWIEIINSWPKQPETAVAPHTGSVD